MKVFLTVVITLLVLVVLGIAYIYSGLYNVAAIEPEGKFGTWLLSTTMDNSVEHHAKGIKAPPLDDSTMIAEGFKQFNRMCVGCHGAPGIEPGEFSKRYNPEPPHLVNAVGDLSDAELFWIIKHGIKMSAMPAYGKSFADDRIWQMASFVRLLPKMTPEQYQVFKNSLETEN